MIKKIVIVLWSILIAVTLLVIIAFVAISNGWIGYMPPVEELENPKYKFASEIFSTDIDQKTGKIEYTSIGTWSSERGNRVYVGYSQLSPDLVNALLATEDIRFAEHSGIDAKALFRAIIKRGLLFQKNAGGGSTITQQLAKQLYSPSADNTLERLLQKPIEWVIATKLERYYTKEEILTMYLNKFDFLNNAVGIKTAAHTYFSKEPSTLSIEEAATLVGMCKNPSLYNPRRHNERTRQRRNVVLQQMEKYGFITTAQSDSLQALPLVLHYNKADHKEGIATYFREYLRTVLTAKRPDRDNYASWQDQKFYEDSLAWETDPLYGWCNKNKKKDGTPYNIYTDGLKIYTTIDSRMQRYAEEAVTEHLKNNLQPQFFKEKRGRKNAPFTNLLTDEQLATIMARAVKNTDRYRIMRRNGCSEAEIRKAFDTPREMSVFTWEGERDTVLTPLDSLKYYKHFLRAGFMSMDPSNGYVKAYVGGPNFYYFQYDMAMVGRRQVGSTIKPYLYALAMENGFSPCDKVRNVQQTVLLPDGKIWAPRNDSKKHIGEMVTLKWGLANSNNWISAYLMGKLNPASLVTLLHTLGIKNREIDPTPSLCLGPCEISVGEMVSAYTAFANMGMHVEPLFVTRIESSDGEVISTFTPSMNEALSRESAYKMIDMLRAVVNEGTGGRVRFRYGIQADMGGKTGTSNGNSDGWFMGFIPTLVSGCWVGGEERDIHFDTMYYGQGASMALPIWAMYMNKVYADPDLGYDPADRFDLPEDFNPCKDTLLDIYDVPDGLDYVFE